MTTTQALYALAAAILLGVPMMLAIAHAVMHVEPMPEPGPAEPETATAEARA